MGTTARRPSANVVSARHAVAIVSVATVASTSRTICARTSWPGPPRRTIRRPSGTARLNAARMETMRAVPRDRQQIHVWGILRAEGGHQLFGVVSALGPCGHQRRRTACPDFSRRNLERETLNRRGLGPESHFEDGNPVRMAKQELSQRAPPGQHLISTGGRRHGDPERRAFCSQGVEPAMNVERGFAREPKREMHADGKGAGIAECVQQRQRLGRRERFFDVNPRGRRLRVNRRHTDERQQRGGGDTPARQDAARHVVAARSVENVVPVMMSFRRRSKPPRRK
jgi:hypothetical protein